MSPEHDDTIDWLDPVPAESPPAAKWARGMAYIPKHRRGRFPTGAVVAVSLLLLTLAGGGTATWAAQRQPSTAAPPSSPYRVPTPPQTPRLPQTSPSIAPAVPKPSPSAASSGVPALSPTASPSQPVPPAGTADTVVCTWVMGTGDCQPYSWEIQPPEILFFSYASYTISDITWSGYGTGVATGQGIASTNNCVPSCAGGSITTAPVTFTVQNLVPYDGGLAYDTITIPSGEYMLLTEGS